MRETEAAGPAGTQMSLPIFARLGSPKTVFVSKIFKRCALSRFYPA